MTKLLNSDFWFDRLECARRGYGLDKLVHDEDFDIRGEVAKHGFGLMFLKTIKTFMFARWLRVKDMH